MPQPAHPASLAAQLKSHPRWRPSSMVMHEDPPRLIEVLPRTGLAPGVPLLTHPTAVAALVELLDAACTDGVTWTVGRDEGGYHCELRRGEVRKRWEGGCVGEVLAEALLSRWGRMPPG